MEHGVRMLVAGLVVCGSWATSAAAPAPVEAYGNLPEMIDVDINPAGTRLAWIETNSGGTRIVIHDLASHKTLRTLGVPATNRLRAVYWVNDDTILLDQHVTYSFEGSGKNADDWQRWTALDATGTAGDRMLLMNDPGRRWVTGASLVRRNTSRPGKVYMSTLDFSSTNYRMETGSRLAGGRKDSGWISYLYEVDVATGNGRSLESGTSFTIDWLTDAAAERVARSDWNPTTKDFQIYVKDKTSWRSVYKATGCGRMSLVSFASTGDAIVARGASCKDERRKLWSIALDGSGVTALIEDPALEVERVIYDPLDDQPLGVRLGGPEQPTRWLDARAEQRAAGLRKAFATGAVSLVGRSLDYQRVVVLAESASHPPIYYLVDYAAKKADIINERYPLLDGVPLASVREFDYEARDQYPLLAYLTIPSGAQEKKLPLVVLPHGGPEARDDPGFDWLTQFLASRGYAVLQPQFRGSSGFGQAHADAGRHQWGLRMQDDVTDGVRAVIAAGIADPDRVCIVGWSYGGYAALAGAAFTPELYACAASIAGVSDLPVMIGHVGKMDGKESNSLAYWREHIGSQFDAQVIAKSPARNVAAIRAPVLLLHGNEDTTVPIEQSKLMARALAAASKKYQLVELPGDDHNLSASVTRVRMLGELEKFLAPFLAAQPAK